VGSIARSRRYQVLRHAGVLALGLSVLQYMGTAPFIVHRMFIRFLQPFVFSGFVLLWLLASSNPVSLAVSSFVVAAIIGTIVYRWFYKKKQKFLDNVAPVEAEYNENRREPTANAGSDNAEVGAEPSRLNISSPAGQQDGYDTQEQELHMPSTVVDMSSFRLNIADDNDNGNDDDEGKDDDDDDESVASLETNDQEVLPPQAPTNAAAVVNTMNDDMKSTVSHGSLEMPSSESDSVITGGARRARGNMAGGRSCAATSICVSSIDGGDGVDSSVIGESSDAGSMQFQSPRQYQATLPPPPSLAAVTAAKHTHAGKQQSETPSVQLSVHKEADDSSMSDSGHSNSSSSISSGSSSSSSSGGSGKERGKRNRRGRRRRRDGQPTRGTFAVDASDNEDDAHDSYLDSLRNLTLAKAAQK